MRNRKARGSKVRKYAAFISYAESDERLARALHDLFHQLGENVYFAPNRVPITVTPEWRRGILEEMSRCRSIIPVFSRNSLQRPWIHYELGAAAAMGLRLFSARTSNVENNDIFGMPSPPVTVYRLFDQKDLRDLVVAVCTESHGRMGLDESEVKRIDRMLTHSRHARYVLCLANRRWVFIAGNVPRGEFLQKRMIRIYKTMDNYKARLKRFTQVLTCKLLEQGFSITCCPPVPLVGKVAFNEATRWPGKHPETLVGLGPEENRARMAGLYPIDRSVREARLHPEFRQRLRMEILEFRKSYLAGQEWLVLMGGSEGGCEEYEAAKSLKNVRIFAIPCSGGAARRVYDRDPSTRHWPCNKCRSYGRKCPETVIGQIAAHMHLHH
jgi:hypothetical protein